MAHGEYTHVEIPYDDEARATSFYANVFGWSFTPMAGMDGYQMAAPGPGDLSTGFGRRGVTGPAMIRNYIEVDDLGASLDAVSANGGTVKVGKTDIGQGWYAAVDDSEGNEIGLYQPKSRA